MSRPFAHLHLHSQYSILDGAIRIKSLPSKLKQKGFEAAALTDHGNLYGAVEFYHAMKKGGVKPIIGMEAYVANGTRFQRKYDRMGPNATHLVLLCQNREGYQNLIRLSSLAFQEGKYFVPRIDRELLEKYHRGLIALSACQGGLVARPYMAGDEAGAREAAQWAGQVFDGRFYLELQNHQQPEDEKLNRFLVGLGDELGLPLVGTNDCHYLEPEEAYPHYLLQLMGWQKKVTDPGVEPFVDRQLYLKSPEEMAQALADYPAQAYDNSWAIAEACELSLDNKKFYLPRFDIPAPFDEAGWFKKMAQDGLAQRLEVLAPLYGVAPEGLEEFRRPYQERLEFELEVISKMNYAGYFLIVAEFINWAKDHGVRVGPGRGSGAGSLVAYAMRITDLDPIHHGLIFERFLNPDRVSLPDFDIDFDVVGRDEVIRHVRDKYGEDRVSQIATFGTLGAKAGMRGVARVLDFAYSDADKIAKLIPDKLGITLDEAIGMEPQLARLEQEGTEREKQLISYTRALEGLNDKVSTHAAGVIIMDVPIVEIMPTCSTKDEQGVQSQYGMKWAEDQGAVKFDFLGLLNLTIIESALRQIDETGVQRPDVDNLPLDDKATYELLSRGDTMGVFQLESGGMRRLLMDMKPTCFEDLVAILALYRPGPLGSGMVDDFVKCKNGQKEIRYSHPLLEPVLKETYGVMVYQEQVMKAVQVLAGFSLGQADLLRRAIGKKIPEVLAEQRGLFVEGCLKNNIPEAKANEIFDLIDYFSGYGFNKSHSAAYGMVAYQTAWLKAHYPVEFMAALLSSDMDNTDKVVNFIAETRQMGLAVLPPDINKSGTGFTIDGRAIRFGLNALKNVGANAAGVILEARLKQPEGRFASLAQFIKTVDMHRVNKRVMEAMIKAGAFDSIHPNRAQLLTHIDRVMETALKYRNSQVEGQESLFGLLSQEEAAKTDLVLELPPTEDFRPRQRLKLEKESLGFFISGHPLEGFASEIGNVATSTVDLREGDLADGAEVLVAGVVGATPTVRLTRNGEKMAIFRLEDTRGSVEVVVFPKVYSEAAPLLGEDQPLLIQGRLAVREGEVNVQANRVMSLSLFRANGAQKLLIELPRQEEEALRRMTGLFHQFPGHCQVAFQVTAENGCKVMVGAGLAVSPEEALVESLEALLGGSHLSFEYGAQPLGEPPQAGRGNGRYAGGGNGPGANGGGWREQGAPRGQAGGRV